uniref:Bacterial transcriptional activator domain-containing protein n=1 Tax=candidate division WOR-3 bacterium TaxID=2052148 RepID=A0A7C4XKY3_UNCW3
MLPRNLLVIQSSSDFKVLLNNGFYISTDYSEFEQTLARAKALLRAGEWEFAKKEFLQAFKLFRGEPFKKNFDDWSVNMRFRILTELETEAINFAKACFEHNDRHNSKKVLEKVLKIIPNSEEIKNLLDGFMVG